MSDNHLHGLHRERELTVDDDADTASQRSIDLDDHPLKDEHQHNNLGEENPNLAHEFLSNLKHESHPYTLDTDFSDDESRRSSLCDRHDHDNAYDAIEVGDSPLTSAAPSVHDDGIGFGEPKAFATHPLPPRTPREPTYSQREPAYPPTSRGSTPRLDGTESIKSLATSSSNSTTYSRKARPESTLFNSTTHPTPLILGIALIDFNHLQGPRIEFSEGEIFADNAISLHLPFLALPDGAHLAAEDYSYFHLVPSSTPNPSTIFGISCNRQIAAEDLLVKDPDVTRSTVQKAVVVLASEPVFGPIRDKLGVVTRALFLQRDFTSTTILLDFAASLESSLRSQLTESGLYMGTSLRELVHLFRQRTLVLLKALMLQKKIMFYGHPVEKLCTYQYSLISLLPGLLQTLRDCGSPPLASRALTLTKPNSLKTSDRRSMMAYIGLPLDVFGKDAFFQPYLPLQQMDILKETGSWVCGCTNSIVSGLKEVDLLINIETGTFEFRDPKLERSAGLTAADRKWMDDIVRDVNEGWDQQDPTRPTGMQFKGSDDYLRSKFDEYVSAALASVRYRNFIAKGEVNGVMITGGTGADVNSSEDFNPLWIAEFKKTNAYEVWDRTTDPMLFDIVEPRHPCNEKPTVVSDIGLRLSEGLQELKLDQQLAPTREAISRTFTAGSTGFLKAVEGVRGRFGKTAGPPGSSSTTSLGKEVEGKEVESISSTPVEVSRAELGRSDSNLAASAAGPNHKDVTPNIPSTSSSSSSLALPIKTPTTSAPPQTPTQAPRTAPRQQSVDLGAAATHAAIEAKAAVGAWGAGIGSFLSTRASRFSIPKVGTAFVAGGNAKASPVVATPVQTPSQVQPERELPPPPSPSPPSKAEEPASPVSSPVATTPTTPPTLPSRVKATITAVETPASAPTTPPAIPSRVKVAIAAAQGPSTITTSTSSPPTLPSRVRAAIAAAESPSATATPTPVFPSRVRAAAAAVEAKAKARQSAPQAEQEQSRPDTTTSPLLVSITEHLTKEHGEAHTEEQSPPPGMAL